MKKSIMWDYIREEQAILNNLIQDQYIKKVSESLHKMEALYIVCHGSSYNAATAIAGFMTRMSGIRIYVYTPSNFMYNCASIDRENPQHTWVMAISQTGTSRGVIEAGQAAIEKGFHVIAITNIKQSPIDKMAHETLYFQCGEEESNAKTKGYSCTLTLLMLMAIYIGVKNQQISIDKQQSVLNEILSSIEQFDEMLPRVVSWCEKLAYGKNMKELYVVGNGMNFGTAMEGQLKLMETMCIPTMFNDIEEFSHGMHRALHNNSHVILINTEVDRELMNQTYGYLKDHQIPVLMLDTLASQDDTNRLAVKNMPNTQSVLLMTYIIQILSVQVPEFNGLDPNRIANDDYTNCVTTRI